MSGMEEAYPMTNRIHQKSGTGKGETATIIFECHGTIWILNGSSGIMSWMIADYHLSLKQPVGPRFQTDFSGVTDN